jgi:hypothetical protein
MSIGISIIDDGVYSSNEGLDIDRHPRWHPRWHLFVAQFTPPPRVSLARAGFDAWAALIGFDRVRARSLILLSGWASTLAALDLRRAH